MTDPTPNGPSYSWVLVHERDTKNAVRYMDPMPDGEHPCPTKQLYLDRTFVEKHSQGKPNITVTFTFTD